MNKKAKTKAQKADEYGRAGQVMPLEPLFKHRTGRWTA
jgi:hypothetical protein